MLKEPDEYDAVDAEAVASPETNDGHSPKSDYEVGFGKPPKHAQFKKGQSGNSAGRKKTEDIEDLRVMAERVFAEPVEVQNGGGVRTMSRLEAMLHTLRTNALKGNNRSARSFFKLAQKAGLFSKAKPQSNIVLTDPGTEEQKSIVRGYQAEQAALKRSKDATINGPASRGRSEWIKNDDGRP